LVFAKEDVIAFEWQSYWMTTMYWPYDLWNFQCIPKNFIK